MGKNNNGSGLLLHSVDDTHKLSMSSYPTDRFKQFLLYLKDNGIECATVSEYIKLQRNTLDEERNAVGQIKRTAITFDDGLQSFYDNAFPLLEEYNIKSTLFPVAGLVGKNGGWDVMGRTSHMTAEALRAVAKAGHEIGSHSLTHANLVWLGDNELKKELRDSKAVLEDITGAAVESLSFPFGSWNRRVWEEAKFAGYKYAAAYRGHGRAPAEILPVFGVYRFDAVNDIAGRISSAPSISKTLARVMSHFSKGTPIVKFRKEYVRFPRG